MSLPHEQLLKRRFVLIPALELDFELRSPAGQAKACATSDGANTTTFGVVLRVSGAALPIASREIRALPATFHDAGAAWAPIANRRHKSYILTL